MMMMIMMMETMFNYDRMDQTFILSFFEPCFGWALHCPQELSHNVSICKPVCKLGFEMMMVWVQPSSPQWERWKMCSR